MASQKSNLNEFEYILNNHGFSLSLEKYPDDTYLRCEKKGIKTIMKLSLFNEMTLISAINSIELEYEKLKSTTKLRNK